ncbi:MAG: hypothetical protein OXC37_01285 [Bdellovibrionaceae bacterium]|nr:hypothetical protein [Pseudobdellovibrionaceae bacterium]
MSNSLTKQDLIEQIKYLYETDIGDFKRKTTLYLNRFIEDQESSDLKNKLNDLKHTVLYQEISNENQVENIDKLRFQLIEELQKL